MANNGERLNALENSHTFLHKKLDQLVTVLGNGIDPAYVPEAMGLPLPTAEPNERAAPIAGAGGMDIQTLVQLATLLRPPVAPVPVESSLDKLIMVLAPVLVEKLMDRPDPIAQFAQLKELVEPAMSDQVISAAMPSLMPALIAKLSGETPQKGGGEATSSEGLADAFKEALGSLDKADLAQLIASQAAANGADGG